MVKPMGENRIIIKYLPHQQWHIYYFIRRRQTGFPTGLGISLLLLVYICSAAENRKLNRFWESAGF
jgi:hypothetical protein